MAYAALGMYLVRFFLRSFCSLAACCFAILTLSCAKSHRFQYLTICMSCACLKLPGKRCNAGLRYSADESNVPYLK